MALFQKSVLNKYLKTLEEAKVKEAYQRFSSHFLTPAIQENIRNSKEEQYQGEFLIDLFVNVLGYTKNPTPNFNLTTELKNIKGSKKADGAILKEDKAVAVIELKGTNTRDLDKITTQAFGYKNNHPTCVYIITSNFEKLRFYINDAVDYLDFNLFTLTEEQFKLLYLCLHKDHILGDLPQRIKQESTLEEENITKKLYKDYSAFKKELFNDLVTNNPDVPKLTLFKKSQKLIDRFLFIFFAEDKGLLPPNSISKILKTYEGLEDLDNYKPLYEVFQQYFGYINSGRPARKNKAEIFAFNGGLFKPDNTLDNLKISDEILKKHTLALTNYDFESEVDVNILGHIFEHSLNEIDEMTAELEGRTIEKNKTKRKKDGVFYTPKYITKYIVDNTVGKLCEAQKEAIGIKEDEYRPKRKKATKKRLLADLETYREYLLSLTICDPACGSGAFLNQALDFLIKEHHYIDELQTRLLGGSIILSDITNDILERNIYGVDINEESVEIARLSLWLRSAKKGRALTTLSNNIKCGNSLIDDKEVAGEKAFDWEKEFPEVFKKGGFDVVIGNPPYLAGREWSEELNNQRPYFIENYACMTDQFDLYGLFIEKCKSLLKIQGLFSFITPNTWFNNSHYIKLRKWAIENFAFEVIADYKDVNVFKEATVLTAIFIFRQTNTPNKNKEIDILTYKSYDIFQKSTTSIKLWEADEDLIFKLNMSKQDFSIIQKIETDSVTLRELGKVKFGVKVYQKGKGKPKQQGYESKQKIFESESKEDDSYYPYLRGKNINSFVKDKEVNFLKYGLHLAEPRTLELFQGGRILIRRIVGEKLIVHPLKETFIADQLIHTFKPSNEENYLEISSILHSRLIAFYFKKKYGRTEKTFPEIRVGELGSLPIKESSNLSKYSIILLEEKIKISNIVNKFLRLLNRKLPIEKPSKKLQNWHTLTFTEFVKELKKKKIKLGLAEEAEWEDYFEAEKAKAQAIQAMIDKTDKEIDQMVYGLYGLTEEEIGIIENS